MIFFRKPERHFSGSCLEKHGAKPATGFMSSDQSVPSAGRPLSPGAVALMLMLCVSWGFNQIAVKLALPDIPPMLQRRSAPRAR